MKRKMKSRNLPSPIIMLDDWQFEIAEYIIQCINEQYIDGVSYFGRIQSASLIDPGTGNYITGTENDRIMRYVKEYLWSFCKIRYVRPYIQYTNCFLQEFLADYVVFTSDK